MMDDRIIVWRNPRSVQTPEWRVVSMRAGARQLNIVFTHDDIVKPGRVRREIYSQMRQHFPDYQRLVPRRRYYARAARGEPVE